MFSAVLQRFVDQAPCCVMVRGVLESVFAPAKLDALFDAHADRQYTRELLFSTMADILAQVVCRTYPSVHGAYQAAAKRGEIAVSVKALYDKLAHTETQTLRALVRHTAAEVAAVLAHLRLRRPSLLPGYGVRILDGNHPEGTAHRLGVLRDQPGGALPGVVVAVLDPQQGVIEDVALSEDGHAQECTLLGPILDTVRARQLWLADRHYCTSALLFSLARRRAFFLIRQHLGHLRWRRVGRRRYRGRCGTGKVYEQQVALADPESLAERAVRRITVVLDRPTRDGDRELHLLSNVPAEDATPLELAELYRQRWQLETTFQELTVHLRCELNTLGYPPAALFGFCMAVACYNVLAAVKGAVRAAQGEAAAENLSGYYVTDEVSGTYRGMAIAVPEGDWAVFRSAGPAELARLVEGIARAMDVNYYKKHKRAPKKPKKPRRSAPRKHYATARLLNRNKSCAK